MAARCRDGRRFAVVRKLSHVLTAVLLSACVNGQAPGPGMPGAAFGLTERVPVDPLPFPLDLPAPTPLQLARAFPSLSFERPLFLTYAPGGADDIYVVEQGGRILVFPNDDTVTEAAVFLDIEDRVVSGGERGLLGLAFDPAYAENGFFYVHYSAASPERSVIARYSMVVGEPYRADPGSEKIVLEVMQPFSNHNGGMLASGPDGMLYIGLGDGGSGGDPLGNGQRLGSLLGSMLRIDVNRGDPYAIPPDNPFQHLGDGVRPEIWAYGLRNPFRFSFDRQTGELWVGDVGQNRREEIDLVLRGGNYGWNVYEGDLSFRNPDGRPPGDFVAPIIDYDHTVGSAVTGGYVYRGNALPSLRGAYVYGDFISGRIWALVYDGTVRSNTVIAVGEAISSFGEDRDGELYVVSYSGALYRFAPAAPQPAATLPSRLSQTGLFVDPANLVPAAGLIEYEVNVPLWSDGTRKRRWIALPGTATVAFHPTEAWAFPVGTVLVKHFELDLVAGLPQTARRLETRVLVHESKGWAGYTYRWNERQSDAHLLNSAAEDVFLIEDPDAPGGERLQRYRYPSRAQCLRCHTRAAGVILGVRTRQLNRLFDYPLATDNQLRVLNHIGVFDRDIGAATQYQHHAAPDDIGASLDARARAYLAANCGHCHRPDNFTGVAIDLRSGIPLAAMNLVHQLPVAGALGLRAAFLISPGNKASSVLWERMRRLDANRMPPVGSHRVDALGVSLIGEWIDSGP